MNKSLKIQVDLRAKQPVYQQIVEQVEHMVARGEMRPGDQLPTVRQLAADLRVNFNTVARAYRILDEARVISTQHGRGTYIWGEPAGQGATVGSKGSAPVQHAAPTGPAPEKGKTGRLDGQRAGRSLNDIARQYFAEAQRQNCSEAEALSILEAEFDRWQKVKHS